MPRRRKIVDNRIKVYCTKPEICVSRNYTYYVVTDLYRMDGSHMGRFKYGDFPEDVIILNKSKDTDYSLEAKPIHAQVYDSEDLFETGQILLNGYFYGKKEYYSDVDYSKLVDSDFKPTGHPYNWLRKINYGYYYNLKLPTEYKYLNYTLEKFVDFGEGLQHIMWLKGDNEHLVISATDYICMLLNGEKIHGIEPDSDRVVDIQNIITPLGNIPIQEDIDYYNNNNCSTVITYHIYRNLEKKTSSYRYDYEDYVSDIPEGSILEQEDWSNHVDSNIKLYNTVYFNMQNIDDLFKSDALYLTEDYNFPLFDVKKYQIKAFSKSTNFFNSANIPILDTVIDHRVIDDEDNIILEMLTDDGQSITWGNLPFKDVGDLIYDLKYKSEELKQDILAKYEEFKAIYSILNTRPLESRGLEVLSPIGKNTFMRKLTWGKYDDKNKKLSTSYGDIYIHQRSVDSTLEYVQASEEGYYSLTSKSFDKQTGTVAKVRQFELKEQGLAYGSHPEMLYLDIPSIEETYEGIEITLAVSVLKPNARKGSIKPEYSFLTNFLVSDLPWVKSGDRYYIHTTMTDLIVPESVFQHLTYNYNLLRMIQNACDGYFFDDMIQRGRTRAYANYLIETYGEVGILDFEI